MKNFYTFIDMILHVCTGDEWMNCSGLPFYHPYSFQSEGFIHCCLESQLPGVLERYFIGKEDLYLLSIDERKVNAEVIFEGSANNEKFPHVYGPIERAAILKVEKLEV
jgi:uncharacterized protein (DUF952 family)